MPRRRERQNVRGMWEQVNMTQAIAAVQNGMSVNLASHTCEVPRRTLRRYLAKGQTMKSSLGRKTVLTGDQEAELSQRIIRLAEIGYPITSKVLRRCVYRFTLLNNLKTPFNETNKMAGRFWLKGFMDRHPEVRQRKAQNLNPARAQKMNKIIVDDYFSKLKSIMETLNIQDKPENIYNIDEKGCRLSLHHQQKVLAKKGARRVHIVSNEHGQNVSIVSCGSAIGTAIPPMILFKGKRLKSEWGDSLPAGSTIQMTERGSMTQETFVMWLEHFSRFKVPGDCLLIFDGAKCHLDYTIAEAAERLNITLLCLPSNTTHELQPLDKAVFRAYEYHWDDEVSQYFSSNPAERSISKLRFGRIFSKVWDKTMTPANIKAGFKATGIYPFNAKAIPDIAFAPSTVTNREFVEPEQKTSNEDEQLSATNELENEATNGNTSINKDMSQRLLPVQKEPQPSTSGVKQNQFNKTGTNKLEISTLTGRRRKVKEYLHSDSSSAEESSISLHDESSDTNDQVDSSNSDEENINVSFKEIFKTPDIVSSKDRTPRKPAINSKAQIIKKSLFSKDNKQADNIAEIKKPPKKNTKGILVLQNMQ